VYRLRGEAGLKAGTTGGAVAEQIIAGGALIGLAFDPTGGFVLASSDTVYRFAEGRL
jgi:hypothetical protein